jgi:uroporphyrinogen-III decarboxylase
MDWLLWLYPPDEMIYRITDNPDYVAKLLNHINEAKFKRLEFLMGLGADGVFRRGWYETAELFSPAMLREFAHPWIQREVEAVHREGGVYVYTIDTGIRAIAKDLAKLDIDCINGADPVQGDMTVREIREAFPDKTLWGGLSGPGHFASDHEHAAADALREAVSVYGGKRLVLGMACSFRHYYPWENFLAAEKTWREVR